MTSSARKDRLNLYSVYIGQLPGNVKKKEVLDMFSACGFVQDIFVMDSDNKQIKHGFVRYLTPEEAMKAVSKLNKKEVNGQSIIVNIADDTQNRIKKCTDPSSQDTYCLYSAFVGNLHPDTTVREINVLFSAFGEVKEVWIDHYNGKEIKYGFVRYSTLESVKKAVSQLHQRNFKNRSLIVDFSHDVKDQIKTESQKRATESKPLSTRILEKNEPSSNLKNPSMKSEESQKRTTENRLLSTRILEKNKTSSNLMNTSMKTGPSTQLAVSKPQERSTTFTSQTTKTRKGLTYSVYVGNLHQDISKSEIKELFGGCGQIQDVFLTDQCEDTSNRFGFVRYTTLVAALDAVSQLNGWQVKGQPIIVDFAHETKCLIQTEKQMPCKIVPTVDPSIDFPDKFSHASSEMSAVINKSRVQETYCILKCKMAPLKGSSCFHRVLKQVENINFSQKIMAERYKPSVGCKVSAQDVLKTVQNEAVPKDESISNSFMDKYLEMTEKMNVLMSETKHNKGSPMSTVDKLNNTRPASTGIRDSISQVSKCLPSSKTDTRHNESSRQHSVSESQSPLTHCEPQRNTSSCKSQLPRNTSPQKLPLRLSRNNNAKPAQKSLKLDVSNSKKDRATMFERGRMLKEQMNQNDKPVLNSYTRKPHFGTTETKVTSKAEVRISASTSQEDWEHTKAKSDRVSPAAVDLSWASDLFCQLLDSNSSEKDGADSSASSSSNGYCSGYSSFCESPDAELPALEYKSNLKKRSEERKESLKPAVEEPLLLHRSRLFRLS